MVGFILLPSNFLSKKFYRLIHHEDLEIMFQHFDYVFQYNSTLYQQYLGELPAEFTF